MKHRDQIVYFKRVVRRKMLELCAACIEGGGAVDRGTALQAGRSRVQFPMVSLEFFLYIILPAILWPVHRADNLTAFMCRLS